jgi:hydroxypyruvate isomerase|tara:strand:+ start:144 stop:914 length:771 start_codon:yes stop_codon:yes gene_type:complete
MYKFSANLGLLWKNVSQIEAIYKAKENGFDAVEFQFPYENDATEVKQVLDEVNLPVIGINTIKGNVDKGDNGLLAVPSRISEARDAIIQAFEYAKIINSKNIHAMAGITDLSTKSLVTFIDNLKFAKDLIKDTNICLVIEPLNLQDNPGYFLTKVEQAKEICELVGSDSVKIMFDFYHVQINQGNVLKRFEENLPFIGHVQIASVQDRAEPDKGELDFNFVIPEIYKIGYDGYIGAEYKPRKSTEDGLSWMDFFKN